MASKIVPWLLFVFLIAITAYITTKPSFRNSRPPTSHHAQISISQAESLVWSWIKTHRDESYWQARPKLREVTTPEIRDRLHAQVFRLNSGETSCTEPEAYLTKNGKAYPISVGLGGSGLSDMCVCDVDKDGQMELAYTYSWGSGLHRTHVEGYRFNGLLPVKLEGQFVFTSYDLALRKMDDQNVDVYVRDQTHRKPASIKLGELVMRQYNGKPMLDVRVDPKLIKRYHGNIWARTGTAN